MRAFEATKSFSETHAAVFSEPVTHEAHQSVGGRADLSGGGLAAGHASPCGPLLSGRTAFTSGPLHKQPLFIHRRPAVAIFSPKTLPPACTHTRVCGRLRQSDYVQLNLGSIIQLEESQPRQRFDWRSLIRGRCKHARSNASRKRARWKRARWKRSLTRRRHNNEGVLMLQRDGESLSRTHTHARTN